MINVIRSKKGEGYIDVAITVMIVAFVLIFAVNMVSLVALGQNLKTCADRIIDYATTKGTTNIDEYISKLKENTGIDFTYSFSGTAYHDASSGKVQLGEVIYLNLSYSVNVLGFGEVGFPVTFNASSQGVSRIYWK